MKRVLRKLTRLVRPRRSVGPFGPDKANRALGKIGLADGTGSTVYGSASLRFSPLTVEDRGPLMNELDASPSAFKIRLARSRTSSRDAGVLVERRYAWRGYEVHGLVEDPNVRTFVAYRDGNVVGTLSVRVDSIDGLSADEHYRAELDRLRATGARLSEFTRLAVDDEAVSKTVLGGLFHTAFMYLHAVRGCQYGVIEVNPRHAIFYRRGLLFEPMGPQRMNERVKAPSVLLCLTLERLAAEVERFFADPARRGSTRSPLAHWFPPDEAVGVLKRLRALDDV
jgi:hypothetical protein